jgi:RNA polymerase sigma-70 factor (ECF subfamily)
MQTWVEDLVAQYSVRSEVLREYRDKLDKTDQQEKIEASTVAGMIAELRYSITWMRRGRKPGQLRGIDKQQIYQRNAVAELLQADEQLQLLDILLTMSPRERQCFLLHYSKGLTQNEIASILQLSIRTVQTFLKRAKSKAQQEL